jgi:hypothetical protein
MNILDKIYKIIRAYDPTGEFFIKGLMWTLPNTTGALYLLISRGPSSFIIYFVPSSILIASTYSSDYKNKLLNMLLFAFTMAISQWVIAVFFHRQVILIILLFLIIFFIYTSVKRSFLGILAPLFVAIFLELPPGWYNGANRLIETGIAFIIAVIYLFLFEFFTAKFKIRSSIIYFSELIYDSFFCYTTEDKEEIERRIKHKLLYDSSYFNKPDILVENIFVSRRDKFYHKITLARYKADAILLEENYFFRKNLMYAFYAKDVYVFYLRMFRAIGFMRYYYGKNKGFDFSVSFTTELIANIYHRLSLLSNMIKDRKQPEKEFRDSKLIDNWKQHLHKFSKNKNEKVHDDELEFYFGLKCLLADLDIVREKLNSRYGLN